MAHCTCCGLCRVDDFTNANCVRHKSIHCEELTETRERICALHNHPRRQEQVQYRERKKKYTSKYSNVWRCIPLSELIGHQVYHVLVICVENLIFIGHTVVPKLEEKYKNKQ